MDRRRVTNLDDKCLQYKQVTDAQHQIIRLKVLGFKNTEIAEKLGVSGVTVSNVLNSKIHQNQLSILQEAANAETVEIAQRIASVAPRAIEVLSKIVDGEIDGERVEAKVRYKAAVDALAIAGYGKVSKVQSENKHMHLTADDVRELLERGKQVQQSELARVVNG